MKLVIVESPAKAKTINKYLGSDYKVLASFGHIRDLPSKDGSVSPDQDFAMTWELSAGGKKRLSDIVTAVKDADTIVLASDPDREVEAIAWHILEELTARKKIKDKKIDYIILGNHYYETDELHQYFGSPVNEYYLKAYVDHCIKAIDSGLYSYIAHPDLVYYDQESKLYQEEMSRLCAYAKEKDMPLEFNLLGFMSGRHYPNESFWKIASKYQNKAIIGFDAHSPDALLKDDIYQQAFNYLSSLDVELIDTIKTLKK